MAALTPSPTPLYSVLVATKVNKSWTLSVVSGEKVNKGGYTIKLSGSFPGGASARLCLGNEANSIDITGGYKAKHLPELLGLIDVIGGWGKTHQASVIIDASGSAVGKTPSVSLKAPVAPLASGPLTLDSFAAASPKLTYPGNGVGRLVKPVGAYWMFLYGGKVETDNSNRGCDCTTFPMSLFQTFPNMANQYGTHLVEKLGAQKCGLEQLHWKKVVSLFQPPAPLRGCYIAWSAGHMVLVENSITHEFTYGGYKRYRGAERPKWHKAPQGLWWIRKLPVSFLPRRISVPYRNDIAFG